MAGCCSRDEIQGRVRLGICTKVLSKINTSGGKKYSLENSYSPAVQITKNRPVNVGLRKAQKLGVLEISHPVEQLTTVHRIASCSIMRKLIAAVVVK